MNRLVSVSFSAKKFTTAYVLCQSVVLGLLSSAAMGESASKYVSVPPLIDVSSSGDKPNVLFILDNSNSMDEAPSGQAVGSASSGSKSEIARNSIEEIIDTYGGSSRMGLMAYKQSGISKRRLHDSQYDASYNPLNYDPDFTGNRASTTKRFRVPNPSNPGAYIHYNVALPFYSNSNYGSKFCYSTTANFDNGSENASTGPWDQYSCYSSKTNTSDGNSGFSSYWTKSTFSPTDSDYAQNILDFGTNLTWQYVSETWFSNSSPGKGYLHVEVGDVDATQIANLKAKLATSQFSTSSDTPLRNAGLTPIEGSLQSAQDYFSGTLSSTEFVGSGTPSAPPANTCAQQDYVILVTDGLPSVDASGTLLTNTNTAISRAAAEAADLLAQGVRTYVIGFGLPTGVDASLLDTIASAGGTGSTYLANDSVTLLDSLESIFLSFANRDASSSSSAVLANNSRGEGAIFQAVYSPRKNDTLGNEVSWVGSLFGVFLDEEGLIREDTNQNNQLDGYDEDRVAQYYFDTGLGRTQVNLYEGAGPSTPPDLTVDTPVASVDVSDLATIWEARDALGDISDVLTQRNYSDSAANGRYIISSVDGSSTLDFVQISDAQIAALADIQSAAQDALDDAQADLNVAQAQLDGAQEAVNDMVTQRDDAAAARDAAAADLAIAQADLNAANSNVAAAQANLTAAQALFDTRGQDYQDNYFPRVDVMVNSANSDYRDSLDELAAQSSLAEFNALITVLEGEGDASDGNVISAQSDLDTAQQSVSDAQSALANEINAYLTDVNAAESLTRPMMDNLIATGEISAADSASAENAYTNLANDSLVDFAQADDNFSISNIDSERTALIDALIATGINVNKASVRSAIDDYNAARAVEAAQEQILHDIFDNTIAQSLENFFGAQEGLIDAHDGIASAEAGVTTAQSAVAPAQAAVDLAQEALDAAEVVLTEAQSELDGALALLVPVAASYDNILSVYNSALAAYNQATATVNNSDTLISFLDVNSVEEAYNTVKFVRGEDGISGMRSRAIDYDADGTEEIWRLGDIVHSSPALVAAPSSGYDSQFADATYAAFRERYRNRRNVLYVGANDGMLHAFNAGFWDLENSAFSVSSLEGLATEHPLGAELWSYVPRAALPHLQWMTDPNYAHTYYVDGDPITFDANIFPADATHPFGWGTVLMIGMRFGGGEIGVDSDADGTDDLTLRSSYMLFDVTDPEQPPTLIAEISDANLGFTTSVPTVVKKRVKGTNFVNPSQNEWYVAFGSGPTELPDASSTQTSGLYLYDLSARTFVSGYNPFPLETNGFVGDVTSFDDGGDFVDDTLYFGTVRGVPGSSSGNLMRSRLDIGANASVLLSASGPIVAAPHVKSDIFGRRWVHAGSGRLFMGDDNETTQARHFYGVMEPLDSSGDLTWAAVSPSSNFEDATNITVQDSGAINRAGATVVIGGEDIETFDELVSAIRLERDGWKISLFTAGYAERSLSKAASASNVLFFSSYQPAFGNPCFPEGTSRLFGVDMRTGTAIPFEVFAPDDDPDTVEYNDVDAYVSLGQGLASAPIVIQNDGTTIFNSKSTTEQITTDVRVNHTRAGRQSWRQIFLD